MLFFDYVFILSKVIFSVGIVVYSCLSGDFQHFSCFLFEFSAISVVNYSSNCGLILKPKSIFSIKILGYFRKITSSPLSTAQNSYLENCKEMTLVIELMELVAYLGQRCIGSELCYGVWKNIFHLFYNRLVVNYQL